MQIRAILRNALRKRNQEWSSVSNDMQSRETLRNSLGLNYKSAALNQLSYAGATPYESCFQWVEQEIVTTISRTALQKGPKFHGIFLRTRNDLRLPGGRGRRAQPSNV